MNLRELIDEGRARLEQTTTANVGYYEQPFGPPLRNAFPPLLPPEDEMEDEKAKPKRKRMRLRIHQP